MQNASLEFAVAHGTALEPCSGRGRIIITHVPHPYRRAIPHELIAGDHLRHTRSPFIDWRHIETCQQRSGTHRRDLPHPAFSKGKRRYVARIDGVADLQTQSMCVLRMPLSTTTLISFSNAMVSGRMEECMLRGIHVLRPDHLLSPTRHLLTPQTTCMSVME
jgi:hypothetical protein